MTPIVANYCTEGLFCQTLAPSGFLCYTTSRRVAQRICRSTRTLLLSGGSRAGDDCTIYFQTRMAASNLPDPAHWLDAVDCRMPAYFHPQSCNTYEGRLSRTRTNGDIRAISAAIDPKSHPARLPCPGRDQITVIRTIHDE